MRSSDEERREIARELREMVGARCYGRPGVTGSCVDIDDFLTALLDRRVRDCEVSIDSTEALRVADLIDAPTSEGVVEYVPDAGTCRVVADNEGFLVCSNCGRIAACLDAASYCPNCGAKVVD